MSEFHAIAPQATASEGLAQGSYMVTKAGFEHTTLRTKDDESTNDPPRPTFGGLNLETCPEYVRAQVHCRIDQSVPVANDFTLVLSN